MVHAIFGTLKELFAYLWKKKLWWLIPLVLILLLLSALIILGSAAGVGPFIYTIF